MAAFLELQDRIGSDQLEHLEFPAELNRTHYVRIPHEPEEFVRFNEIEFLKEIYPPEVLADPEKLSKRIMLAPTNYVVNTVNKLIETWMSKDLPKMTYLSTNTADAYDIYDPQTAMFSVDNLQQISSSDIPPHILTLRVGMPVMCMQNLDVSEGICNGTPMIVERLDPEVVWCRVKTRYGEQLHPFAPTAFKYDANGFKFTRTQIPLRISFAATINRAQGGTYDRVGYHALKPIWAHGMKFTAWTRVTVPEGFTILCDHTIAIPDLDNPEMLQGISRNIVHPRSLEPMPDTSQPHGRREPTKRRN
jgi:hypothetical protein